VPLTDEFEDVLSSVSDFDNTLLNQNGEAILDGIGSCGRFLIFTGR
jgi:hypothetical protein